MHQKNKKKKEDRPRTCAVCGSGSLLVKMAAPIDLELKKVTETQRDLTCLTCLSRAFCV